MAGELNQAPIASREASGDAPSTLAKLRNRNSRRFEGAREAPVYRSIRFRLTMWYTVALILVILAMSISLHTLLVRALTSDAETRLRNAANEIAGDIVADADTFALRAPSFDSILLSGLWFQVFDVNQQPVDVNSSGALSEPPPDLESALGDSTAFNTAGDTLETIEVGGRESLVLVAPISLKTSGEHAGWVIVGEPLGSRDQIIEVVDSILRIFGILGVVLAVWGGWLLAGRALAPLGRITHTAEVIASSDGPVALSKRLDVPDSDDELSHLALTFNVMLDRIETAFDTQRRFVSDASHELRTPLTSVRGNVDVLLRQMKSSRPVEREDLVEVLGIVQRESGRMGRLIDDMLVLARSDSAGQGTLLRRDVVSLEVVAREALHTAGQLAAGQQLDLEVVEPVTLYGDGDRLVQVILILLDNALRHTPAEGRVEVRIDRALDDEEGIDCARITVRDTGSGIAPEHVPHLFERFYRAGDARSRASGGTGLGLSIALSIVRGHGGWIDVDTAVGEGTTFVVWLPIGTEPEPDGDGADAAEPRGWRRFVPFRRENPVRDPEEPEPPDS